MLNIAPRSKKPTLAGWWLEVEEFRKMHSGGETMATAGRESEETDGIRRSFVLLIDQNMKSMLFAVRFWRTCLSAPGAMLSRRERAWRAPGGRTGSVWGPRL